MPEDNFDDIRKLVDQYARIDERFKALQDKCHEIEEHFEDMVSAHSEVSKKIAVLESLVKNCVGGCPNGLDDKVDELQKTMQSIDKRLSALETDSGKSQDRWNRILTFVIQLAWVVLAAWVLTKLNLQPLAIP